MDGDYGISHRKLKYILVSHTTCCLMKIFLRTAAYDIIVTIGALQKTFI